MLRDIINELETRLLNIRKVDREDLSQYKLLVMDVDGTLLNAENRISEEDQKAVAEARRQGVIVALCTGRVNQATQNVLRLLDLDGYHIFSDGAVVTSADNTKIIYAKTIHKDQAKLLASYVHEQHITSIDFFTPTDEYVEPETQPWYTDMRRNFFGLVPRVTDFRELCAGQSIIKATHAVASTQDREKAREFQRRFGDTLRFSISHNVSYPEIDFYNIIDPGVSKGEALRVLINYLGLSAAECIAIGDGLNDIPLLSGVGMGIAMGHAPAALKKAARYVTLDIAHSGVAAAISKFILEKQQVTQG